MAEYMRRVVVTRRVEFVLPNPSNAAEFAKAYAGAASELTRAGREVLDDTITVSATDNEVVLSFEEDEGDGCTQRQADVVSELGKHARAALRRYRTAVEREPSSEAAEAAQVAHDDLEEVLDRFVGFGDNVRKGQRP